MMRPGLALICALFFAVSFAEAPKASAGRSDIKRTVAEEALKVGFPPSLAMAVAEAESNFQDDAVGPDGARGVMQITPVLARDQFGADPQDLWDARRNVALGLQYLSGLIRRYKGKWEPALLHYHARLPIEAKFAPATAHTADAFVYQVRRLHRRYQKEANLWVAELKGEAMDWPALRPDYGKVTRLARLATRIEPDLVQKGHTLPLDGFGLAIEARRHKARMYLDDFAVSERSGAS